MGAFIALVGAFSTALYFIGYNLRILMWIDSWGQTAGWVIRIGLLVGGLALFLVFRTSGEEEEAEEGEQAKPEEEKAAK